MPIITPTYPHINSTFNVSSNTLKIIKNKLAKANEICRAIGEGRETWESLFKVDLILRLKMFTKSIIVVISELSHIS